MRRSIRHCGRRLIARRNAEYDDQVKITSRCRITLFMAGLNLYRRGSTPSFVTIGALANILSINDKLVRLVGQTGSRTVSVSTNTVLQDAKSLNLGWTDAELQAFLDHTVLSKFGIVILKKNIKPTMNGIAPTIGDLSIAISSAIQRQHRRKNISGSRFRGKHPSPRG